MQWNNYDDYDALAAVKDEAPDHDTGVIGLASHYGVESTFGTARIH